MSRRNLATLELIGDLLSEFDLQDVRYVHWKSNTNIARALSGVDDLDILVHPEDRSTAELIFQKLRIIRARSPKDGWQQGLYHFVGMDVGSCKLVHVHVHYALPVGFDYDKNFVLPVVQTYLTNRWKSGPIYLPEVEKEYAILVLRLIIKNGLTPFMLELPHRQLKRLLSARRGVVRGGWYAEFRDLAARADRLRLEQVLADDFSFLDRAVFNLCEETVQANNSLLAYAHAASALGKNLRPFATNNGLLSLAKSFYRINKERVQKAFARLSAQPHGGKFLLTGGRMIAFVGGDGAGKSTNVQALYSTLVRELAVAKLHIGRPPRSFAGIASRIVARACRAGRLRAHYEAFNLLAVALDRAAAFRKGERLRQAGRVVVVDRVPLPGITRMDCPRIHLLARGRFQWLAKWEAALHRRVTGVDSLIVLKLDPQIALSRRPEDDPNELLSRSGEIWNDHWHAPYAVPIDTGINPPEDVARQVLSIAWASCVAPFARCELVGLSGVGKSRVLAELRERLPNLTPALPYWRYPMSTLTGAALGVPTALRALLHSKHWHAAKNCLQLFAAVRLLSRFERSGFPATHLILDQGPVFQYALAMRELSVSHQGHIAARNACRHLSVINLVARRETVFLRAASRRNHFGRVPLNSRKEFDEFCDGYEKYLSRAAAEAARCTVIDAEVAPSQVAEQILTSGALR